MNYIILITNILYFNHILNYYIIYIPRRRGLRQPCPHPSLAGWGARGGVAQPPTPGSCLPPPLLGMGGMGWEGRDVYS